MTFLGFTRDYRGDIMAVVSDDGKEFLRTIHPSQIDDSEVRRKTIMTRYKELLVERDCGLLEER